MSLQVFDGRAPLLNTKHFLAADSTNKIDMGYSPLPHQLITAILLTNEDTIDHVVALWQKNAAAYFLLGSVNVPAGAGIAAAPAIDLIAAVPLTATGGLLQIYNNQYALSLEVAMVAAHWLDATALGVVF
jgi:hypothetical protein